MPSCSPLKKDYFLKIYFFFPAMNTVDFFHVLGAPSYLPCTAKIC